MEKGSSEGILRRVGGSSEGKVASGGVVTGPGGLEIQSGVREDDWDGGTAARQIAEGEGDAGILGLEFGMQRVIDRIDLVDGVVDEPECVFKRFACVAREPDLRDGGVDVGRNTRRCIQQVEILPIRIHGIDGSDAHDQIPGWIWRKGKG